MSRFPQPDAARRRHRRTVPDGRPDAGLQEFPSINQFHIALGAAPLARDDLDAAEEQFERAVTLSRRTGDRVEMAHALLWLAATHTRTGDLETTTTALEAARRCVPQLGNPVMSQLIDHLKLRRSLPHKEPSSPRHPEPISAAELRVLRLMPGDLTYRQIADRLFVSYNTVRTHARRVLRKLAASSRAEAVARAREQDLL